MARRSRRETISSYNVTKKVVREENLVSGEKNQNNQRYVMQLTGQRAGILTQPSWLTAHSSNFDNDPVKRGKWIYEHLLGGIIPDVPITVDAIGHGKVPAGAKSVDHARGLIRGFQLDNVAKIATKLAKIPEGNGSMLDNTTIIYFSDVGDKHHASNKEWPYLVIGDMGGKLKSAGQYIQYPHKGHAGHHTIASWWLTLLHAAGKPQDGFGMMDKNVDAESQRAPLQELLA